MQVLLLLCYFLCSALDGDAAPAADEVTYLPGLQKQPSFRQFSGYLNVADGKHLHYWSVPDGPGRDRVTLRPLLHELIHPISITLDDK